MSILFNKQHDLVKYIAFMHQSSGASQWWTRHRALEPHSFIRTFSGHDIQHSGTKKKTNVINRNDRILWVPIDALATIIKDAEQKKLKKALHEYAQQSPVQDKRSAGYKKASHVLSQLVQQKTVWTNALLTQWIVSLFLYGSPWKDKLAVNTLLNYHSTIQRFIKSAWVTGREIHATTSEFEICCQYGINQIINAEEQRTVIRFLSFCAQYDAFPPIEMDAFELLSHKSDTRAHYIPPSRFDDICARYDDSRKPTSFPIVLMMQLCYYAGLREDESLSLYIKDIDFDTGMLYVTADKKRKSNAAVRKVPLSLLPTTILSALERYMAQQNQQQISLPQEKRVLFDEKLYPAMEKDFIHFLREELKDNTLVTHSLRHCAANNWVYLLAIMAFKPVSQTEPFFSQHELFSKAQQTRIKQQLKENGHELTPYFPVIDWVSQRIGHRSAAITITHYLHLLDWISLIVTHHPLSITKAALRFWTADSNYGFERQKQLFNASNDHSLTGHINTQALNLWLTKNWKLSPHFTLRPAPNIKEGSELAALK